MNYFLGTIALLGVGFIGLLLEIHKQDKHKLEELQFAFENEKLMVEELQANQKPVPWNKGKKGYKLNRKPKEVTKEVTYVLSDAPVVAAWDKDGKQTVYPEWNYTSESML